MASAFFALNKLEEAMAACTAGIVTDASNASLSKMKERISAEMDAQRVSQKTKAEEEDRQKREAATLANALQARKIRIRNTGERPEVEDAAMKLTPDPLSMSSTLTFPVILLYPLHMQSDFIKAFGEEQMLQGHLAYLFPLPWDSRGEYSSETVDAYMETAEGGMIKWGKKVELLKVLSGGKIEVVDGILRVHLVPKARAPEWIETVKKRKAGT